ncbi:MAG: leucine-rich repeat protein [Clostridia bacterium]|nr:leucine-rich repeat protein [Clostridia bacterium]
MTYTADAMTVEEKIKIIEATSSFAEVPLDVMPKSYKESYYFVSYSHKDYKMVLADILRLEALGVNVWYDNEMHIGENWQEIAQLYISKFQCAGVVFYLTENSIASPACNQEVEYVLTHNKNFISINTALDGCPVQSGYGMLQELCRRGLPKDEALLQSFRRAFGDEILYLDAAEPIEKKAHQILSIPREDLFDIEKVFSFGQSENLPTISACRDNTVIQLDLSKIYGEYSDGSSLNAQIAAIGDCVFTNSVKLQSVTLPSTLRDIGESAFRNCAALEDFDISGTKGVSIGASAFRNCASLQEIDLSHAKSIGKYAFAGCRSLNVKEISGSIDAFAFHDTAVTDIVYREESPYIRGFAFNGCQSLKSVQILHPFRSALEGHAFAECTALESFSDLAAPRLFSSGNDQRVKLKDAVFERCSSLKSMRITGAWDLSDAAYSFAYCTALKELTLDVDEIHIPFCFLRGSSALTTLNLSSPILSIGESAFEECTALSYLPLDDIEEIADCAFVDSGLEKVYLKKVQRIGRSAFANCKSLRQVYIGADCREIEAFAFLGCSSLSVLKIMSENIQVGNRGDLFAYVPSISTVYLRSASIYEALREDGVLARVSVLYIGDNLDPDELGVEGLLFRREPTNEEGFLRFVHPYSTAISEDAEEEESDLSDPELNEPLTRQPKFPCDDVMSLLGKELLIKHRRLRAAKPYFVEQVQMTEAGTVDWLTVSVHGGKSFRLDGSLIESVEGGATVTGALIKLDSPNELDGKTCCIIANDEMHYCTVIATPVVSCLGSPMPDIHLQYSVLTVFYEENGELLASSGLDVTSIVVFDSNFEPIKTITRE